MSERQRPYSGDVYAQSDRNLAELAARYPGQFSGENIGLSWPHGWHGLVAKVCAQAHEHQLAVRWYQIKEKFGGLRMYYRGGPLQSDIESPGRAPSAELEGESARLMAGFLDQVRAAENDSLRTCCSCGVSDSASVVKRRRFNGWWLTSCDACAVSIQACCDLLA